MEPIVARDFTLIASWFATEAQRNLASRRVRLHYGSPLGFSASRLVSGEVWEFLRRHGLLSMAESRDEWLGYIDAAIRTVESMHGGLGAFWRRVDGLTPQNCGHKWAAVRWVVKH